jgi:glycosyltransferase involved in cell wall biosynthesis
MIAMLDVSIMIPTLNESVHLKRLLPLLKALKIPFFVLDSYSSDDTTSLAKRYGGKVIQGRWKTFSEKLNFGLKKNPYQSQWIIRIDADEYFDQNFIKFLESGAIKKIADDVDGIYINRKLYFMGQWMKHGGFYPGRIIRIMRPDRCVFEHKILDEHVEIKKFEVLDIDIIDNPLYDLTHFIQKYIRYAEVYRYGYFSKKFSSRVIPRKGQSRFKSFLQNTFLKSPPFLRCFMYWVYRYFIKFGFLDGMRGLIFITYHAFFYRFLIDSLIYEYKYDNDRAKKIKIYRV